MKKNKLIYRINALVLAIGVIAATVFLNIVIEKLSAKIPMKIDLTENKIFELTEETKGVLKSLDKDVKLYYLTAPGSENTYVMQTLDMYMTQTDKLSLETKDIEKDPVFSKRFTDKGVDINSGGIIVEHGSRAKSISASSMFTGSYNQQGQWSTTGFQLEQKLTKAIAYVTSDSDSYVYFTKGHEEFGFNTLKLLLEDENKIASEIDLSLEDIPENASALYIIGPRRDFSESEIEKLHDYLKGGGKLFLTMDTTVQEPRLLMQFMDEFWGVAFTNDVIVETNSSMMLQGNPLYMIPSMGSHDITREIRDNKLRVLWPESRSIKITEKPGVTVDELASTSSSALSKPIGENMRFERQENDVEGTHVLSAALSYSDYNAKTETKIVVCGSSMFLNSQLLDDASLANRDYVYGIVRYLGDGGENAKLSIAPKSLLVRRLNLTGSQVILYIIVIAAMPALLTLLIGFLVWIRRKHL